MAGNEVGRYVLPIIPSIEGIGPAIDKKLGRAFDDLSKNASKALSEGVKSGTAQAEAAIKASSAKIAALKDKQADAIGRVTVAQKLLTQAEARGNIAGHARAVEQVESARRKEAAATKAVESETRSLVKAEKDLVDAQDRAKRGGGFGGGTSSFLSGITSELNGVTSKFSTVGRGAGAGFAAGAVAALAAGGLVAAGANAAGLIADGFKSVVDAGVDFDKTMNNFQGVTQASASDMKTLREQAIALGGDTKLAGVSAADAADAMTELAKGGFSIQESMEGARGALQLHTAAQISAGEAAKIESSALSAFGLSAGDATHVADLLANVSNKTQGEITDFALALQQAGPAAHGFGLSIDDTLTSLGVFAKMGMRGSDAGTSLKTMLLSLTDGSKPAVEALNDLGVKAYDSNENFVGMRDLFGQIAEAQKRMTPAAFQAASAVLFGSDAIRGAMIAGQNGVPVFDDVKAALEHQGGAAELAAAQMQGLPGIIESIHNTVDTMKLSLYDLMSGPLQSIGAQAQSAFGELASAITSHKAELIGFFTDFATAAATALSGTLRLVGQFTEGIGVMGDGLGDVVGFIDQAAEAFANLTGDDERAKYWHDQAQGAFGWGDGVKAAARALQTTADAVNNLKPGIQSAGDAAKNSAQFVKDLGDHVKLLPDQKTIVFTDQNLPAIQANLDLTKYKVETMPDGEIKLTALTQQATDEMDAWREAQASAPPTRIGVEPYVSPGAIAQLKASLLAGASAPGASPAPPPNSPGSVILPGFTPPRALGGIFDGLRSIASFASGKLPGQAMIQAPVAGAGLVQWAEPSTGGEAFIPINGGDRSKKIWAETGRRLFSFGQGGFLAPDVEAAEELAGTPYSKGNRTDCSGMAARVIARTLGVPESGLMTTKNAAQWLAQLGFQPGTGGPGQLSVGWYDHGPGQNDGHMAITLSDGSNAEAGGSNNAFTIGSGAAGASSSEFDQHMFLPTLFGEGAPGSLSGFGGGAAGGTAGVGPGGQAGSYSAPDPKTVREATEKVADADARSREADLRVKELKADASESEKESAKNAADKAKREAADARADLAAAQKGKFTAAKDGKSGSGSDGGGLGDLGKILGGGVLESFGLDGSVLPNLSELGVVKLANAIMNIGYSPQGDGSFAGGLLGGLGVPGGGGLMTAAIGQFAGIATPDMPAPGTPASGAGFGPPPGPVDQSRNVSISVDSGPTSAEIGNVVRREVNNVDRLHTYVPPGV